MSTYNLDVNEEIDTFTINGTPYEVGDIPMSITRKINNIKTGFLNKLFGKDLDTQWRPICKEILELRNPEVNIDNFTKEKIVALVIYIQAKIDKGQVG